jgi:hypothetical protein
MILKTVIIHGDTKHFQRFTGVVAKAKSEPALLDCGAEENVENSCTKGIFTPTSFDALSRLKFLHSETNDSASGAFIFGEHKVV